MILRRLDTDETLVLDDDLRWIDEGWSPVSQVVTFTLSGGVVIEEAVALAGRPMTFAPESDGPWASTRTLRAARAWWDVPGLVMRLSRGSVDYQVVWRRDRDGLQADPVVHYGAVVAPDLDLPLWLVTWPFLAV